MSRQHSDPVPNLRGQYNWPKAYRRRTSYGASNASSPPRSTTPSKLISTPLDVYRTVQQLTPFGSKAFAEVRQRVQQATTGNRGRKATPVYGIAKVLGLVVENVKPSKRRRTGKTTDADPADEEAFIAWQE